MEIKKIVSSSFVFFFSGIYSSYWFLGVGNLVLLMWFQHILNLGEILYYPEVELFEILWQKRNSAFLPSACILIKWLHLKINAYCQSFCFHNLENKKIEVEKPLNLSLPPFHNLVLCECWAGAIHCLPQLDRPLTCALACIETRGFFLTQPRNSLSLEIELGAGKFYHYNKDPLASQSREYFPKISNAFQVTKETLFRTFLQKYGYVLVNVVMVINFF